MLTIEECKHILSTTGTSMTDEEIEKLRNQLYALVSQLLDNHLDNTVPVCKKQ